MRRPGHVLWCLSVPAGGLLLVGAKARIVLAFFMQWSRGQLQFLYGLGVGCGAIGLHVGTQLSLAANSRIMAVRAEVVPLLIRPSVKTFLKERPSWPFRVNSCGSVSYQCSQLRCSSSGPSLHLVLWPFAVYMAPEVLLVDGVST